MRKPNFKAYRSRLGAYWIYRIIYWIGGVTLFVGVVFLIGIVGHSDLESEIPTVTEIWDFATYAKYILRALLTCGIGFLVTLFGSYAKSVNEDWIARFEERWSSYCKGEE